MSTGKNSGGRTGKNVTSGGGGTDPNAIGDIKIINGEIIIVKRSGLEENLGAASVRAQELMTHSISIGAGTDVTHEITHNLGTKSVMYQVFDSSDETVDIPAIRYENKIKLFFGDPADAATYTVVIAN